MFSFGAFILDAGGEGVVVVVWFVVAGVVMVIVGVEIDEGGVLLLLLLVVGSDTGDGGADASGVGYAVSGSLFWRSDGFEVRGFFNGGIVLLDRPGITLPDWCSASELLNFLFFR